MFLVVHGVPLQAALPGTSVHDRSGRSSGIRPRCLHRCLHLVPPILKPAFAWHRPKESNGCLFTRSAHTTSTLTQGRSPWRHERSHRTTISLRPSSTSAVTVPPTTVPPTTVVPQSPCQISQLRISPGASGFGTGNVGQALLFTNVSQTTCTISGYPGVAALDSHGNQVAQARRELIGYLGGLQNNASSVPVVTLASGQVASAEVEGTDNPVGTATSCTYYPSFLITPPNETHSVTVSAGVVQGSHTPGFPGCSPISVNPMVPGTSGRLN